MGKDLHGREKTIVNVFVGKRIEEFLQGTFISRFDRAKQDFEVRIEVMVSLPFLRIVLTGWRRQDLVLIQIANALGLRQKLLAKSRMSNVNETQCPFSNGLSMQVGNAKLRDHVLGCRPGTHDTSTATEMRDYPRPPAIRAGAR